MKALRKIGHNAKSCDIQPCSGGEPEHHSKWDCDDCEHYPCAHQQMMNDLNAKLKYNTCGDHSERGTP